ncbi:MAG: helix-turn-helix transcriptional regulator [Dysgonamonadaceae bacterium]|jgi:transcriptional regulator with XRE-family HTH domain|nr:helix-turn-helix transcriptional regulator [Dysgonamonadaceae bacterium]MDD3727899.1 helix-turn-helix transcriptional regulator [Dysgonamonadaceae bacterium]
MKDRIKKIMDNEDLTPAKFADQLQINRAVISHILNDRNNPSLDVVLKILSEKDYINSDWLLNGIGSMYKEGYDITPKREKERSLFNLADTSTVDSEDESKYAKESQVRKQENVGNTTDNQLINATSTKEKKIKQIIIYYSDNTFESFTPH